MNTEQRSFFLDIMKDLGEDMDSDGRERTPERWLKALAQFLEGNNDSPEEIIEKAVYPNEGRGPLVIAAIPYTSVCEHHVVPFYGKISIALDPGDNGSILGLSKYTRLVDCVTRRLQIQERIGQQIADALDSVLQPDAVVVGVSGVHMCCKGRGIRSESTWFNTYAEIGEPDRTKILYHLIEGTF